MLPRSALRKVLVGQTRNSSLTSSLPFTIRFSFFAVRALHLSICHRFSSNFVLCHSIESLEKAAIFDRAILHPVYAYRSPVTNLVKKKICHGLPSSRAKGGKAPGNSPGPADSDPFWSRRKRDNETHRRVQPYTDGVIDRGLSLHLQRRVGRKARGEAVGLRYMASRGYGAAAKDLSPQSGGGGAGGGLSPQV